MTNEANTGSGRWLNLILEDSTRRALSDRTCKIMWDDGSTTERDTDGDGRLSVQVPAGVSVAELITTYRKFRLLLDGLPEAHTVAGFQERLNQLNYDVGTVDGALGPKTQRGISAFQQAVEVEVTGEMDERTLEHLQQHYGS